MTTLLEARYRTVLRLLPAHYRREREDEMVETYLWDVDRDTQDQSRPTAGEVVSLAALALRSRLAATGAPRPYALLGSAVRHFALFAVLLQAAAAIVDRVLALTWATTHGTRQWDMFLSGFTGQGVPTGVVEVAQWTLPLLWTVGFFALVHDRRRLARTAVLLAALPTLWPLVGSLVSDLLPPDPWFVTATATALFAWLSALALCTAYHRDAPAASLGWLLLRARRKDQNVACPAVALAALGLLLLAVRVAALYPWLGLPLPVAFVAGAVGQVAALTLLTTVLAVVARRDLVTR